MVAFSKELLVDLLAPGFDEFTEASIDDLRGKHPEAGHWIANHFLNSILRAPFPRESKPMILNVLYRAQAAFEAYHHARTLTVDFIAGPRNPGIAKYFGALASWEATILNTQMAQEIIVKLTVPMFTKNDGSDDERLWEMAARIKHCGADIASGKHGESYTVPMWLTNNGLRSRTAQLTWKEMSTHVDALASLADTLQDATAAAEKHRKQFGDMSK